jgi:transcriptional regulator with GAF, ATPase, and Fis domain
LFYRLNVVPLRVPPLRERASDIPLLATFFAQQFGKKMGKQIVQITDDVMRRLASYPWPGNIRELQNVIERAVILSPSRTLMLAEELRAPADLVGRVAPRAPSSDMPDPGAHGVTRPTTKSERSGNGSLEEVERRHIESVLNQTNWMIEGERGAAKILNLNPSTLRSRMQKLGIRRPMR